MHYENIAIMKNIKLAGPALGSILVTIVLFSSCEPTSEVSPAEIPANILAQLAGANFNTRGVKAQCFQGKKGYVVEGDIFLTPQAINELGNEDRILDTDQYYSTNLVSVHSSQRVLKIRISPRLGAQGHEALDTLIKMYNSLNLAISLQEASKEKADIEITTFYQPESAGFVSIGLVAGFPDSHGNPARGFGINTRWIELFHPTSIRLAGVMAHEVGHCIGLRHNDSANRESCGQYEVIDGTPNGFIYNLGTSTTDNNTSIMQTCPSANLLNFKDKIALNYLY
jgi:hypothetical protein